MFSAQGRDPNSKCKLTGSVKKEFDKLVRGYVYALEGGSSTTTTRIQLPKTEKSSCELTEGTMEFELVVFLCSVSVTTMLCVPTPPPSCCKTSH